MYVSSVLVGKNQNIVIFHLMFFIRKQLKKLKCLNELLSFKEGVARLNTLNNNILFVSNPIDSPINT